MISFFGPYVRNKLGRGIPGPACGWRKRGSLHFREVARLPGAVERGLFRAVDAEVDEPALAGDNCRAAYLLTAESRATRKPR
jgi:hypothetical protein